MFQGEHTQLQYHVQTATRIQAQADMETCGEGAEGPAGVKEGDTQSHVHGRGGGCAGS